MLKLCVSAISWVYYNKLCHILPKTTTIDLTKVMYSRDLPWIDLTKSCIHATYHKSRHYLTLMTVENTPRRIPTSHIPEFLRWPWTRLSEVNGMSQWTFLTSWPWPLTYGLDLQTWPRYLSTWPPCKNSCSFGRDGETGRHTDRHTMSKLLHPSRQRHGV